MSSTRTARDVFATLATQRPGFPPTHHPFVVFIRYTDGSTSQEVLCANLRDCLICGNGMLSAMAAFDAGGREYAVNVVFDERFAHGSERA